MTTFLENDHDSRYTLNYAFLHSHFFSILLCPLSTKIISCLCLKQLMSISHLVKVRHLDMKFYFWFKGHIDLWVWILESISHHQVSFNYTRMKLDGNSLQKKKNPHDQVVFEGWGVIQFHPNNNSRLPWMSSRFWSRICKSLRLE